MSAPGYSILISSRNEGESLRRTVDDVVRRSPPGDFEVIVVDDASNDGSADFARDPKYVGLPIQVHRNEGRRGLIFSRQRAAARASGEHLVFLDAHSAVSDGWLTKLSGALRRIEGRGIAAPLVHFLDTRHWTIDLNGFSCAACSIANPFLDFCWVDPQIVDGQPCTCAIGGMAWMCRREWYQHIGALDGEMTGWGGENIDIALRTWVAGGWCIVADNVLVGHLFKSGIKEPIDPVSLAANKIRAAHSIFSREVFERVLNRLQHIDGFHEALKRVHSDPGALGALKDRVESIRKRSDRWLIETFRLPILEMPQFYLPVGAPRSREGRSRQKRCASGARPMVTIVVSVTRGGSDLAPLLHALADTTTYRNCEIVILATAGSEPAPLPGNGDSLEANPMIRLLSWTGSRDGIAPENLGAALSGADYLALVDEDVVILDEHWIEKFILLFESHPRALLACPRSRWIGPGPPGARPEEDFYDVVWDWNAPGASRIRRSPPPSGSPYHALSCPQTLLFARRDPFVRLGGFEASPGGGSGALTDLAIRAWLSGHEVYCDPTITAGRKSGAGDPPARGAGSRDEHHQDLCLLLTAIKCFRDTERIRRLYQRSVPSAQLSRDLINRAAKGRAESLRRLKFDDDWLFYKFRIEDPGISGETSGPSLVPLLVRPFLEGEPC